MHWWPPRKTSKRRVASAAAASVGASSLTLLQVHEKIEELYPNAVDLTELFDYPTISQLAKHLEKKLEKAISG